MVGFFSKRNLTIVFIIVSAAISLGAIVYFYYSFSTIEVNKIASQDVRSNSRIETHDFARILENEIDTIGTGGKIWAENNSHPNRIVKGNEITGTGATSYYTLLINNGQ